LKLSNFFQDWPQGIKRNGNGIVEVISKKRKTGSGRTVLAQGRKR
jgi:hypothetical protein